MVTREMILEKSREIFFKKGYFETSLLEIANECKISKGGLYHHFERKEDLFIETMILVLRENERIVMSCIEKDGPFKEAIKEFAEKMLFLRNRYFEEGVEKHSNSLYLGPLSNAIKSFPQIGEENRKLYGNIFEKVVIRIKKAQKLGEIRKEINPEILAIQFCAIFEGLPIASYYAGKDFDEVSKSLFKSLWDLIKI
ncbi:transcriptional regulator, TetR family [Methanococcus vannielii SB]|uniref:Transcriptional regulator, TetR family n=1 Tax=Methanococcus vannielii (strain ATCC 35089 / DSM 1224 / JCM 13029 / OCM 148 / SB) TaxID=406327 RepID=A6USP0_METVS|nr:TetR/AcrR family transcriptional regulator [Methanococcus vannielii]ABR55512.1 transcriptional regulator, TetR family [Methanococcus vannielii SB]